MAKKTPILHGIQALEQAGCQVTVGKTSVLVRFPPAPNDPHAAPDGDEREFDLRHFSNTAALVYARLVAKGAIKEGGD